MRDANPVTEIVGCAADISARAWDALIEASGFYNSHAWVQGLETAHGTSPVLTSTAEGRLIGVLPTWQNTEPSGLFSVAEMTRGLSGPWDQEFLWLGTRRGTANTIICTHDPVMRRRALGALLEKARQLAAAQGLPGAVWPYLTGEAALQIEACHPLAQAVLHSADSLVTIPHGGMKEMESAAESKDRKKWRREQRLFRESYGTVEWATLSPQVSDLIAPLLARTRTKYGASGGTAWIRRTLSGQLASGVARSAVAALTRTGGDVTAAAVFYHHRDWLYGRYWGASPAAPQYAYYVLTCYEAIDAAAVRGCRYLHLSVPASPSKMARGARPMPLAFVYIPAADRKETDDQVLRRHNQRVALELAKAYSPPLGTIWEPWVESSRS
ncbi:GNAT family N-acetyltransferase [Streptomyces sp. 110]|uniref:GNAT family N-acetyltransferase n=1 Tax=Streptomyces endocoffeicus TaxID=2898945 RepID=A0ABS1PS54_9ACTN|nr:GNAT family N-acetyltransferase [Streptomyces endocoffeicus]MBL1115243.1 GNAT family N-acetyltransferase [Streptomyces endocoffeicus]